MDTGSGFKSQRCSSIASLGVGGVEWGGLVSEHDCLIFGEKKNRKAAWIVSMRGVEERG